LISFIQRPAAAAVGCPKSMAKQQTSVPDWTDGEPDSHTYSCSSSSGGDDYYSSIVAEPQQDLDAVGKQCLEMKMPLPIHSFPSSQATEVRRILRRPRRRPSSRIRRVGRRRLCWPWPICRHASWRPRPISSEISNNKCHRAQQGGHR
jgi:hypothetical protein